MKNKNKSDEKITKRNRAKQSCVNMNTKKNSTKKC